MHSGRCAALASIIIDENNSTYDSRDNCNAIIETASNTLIAGCKNTAIPDSVTSIASQAFDYHTGLTSITIPDNVTSIGACAFRRCSFESVTIPASVNSIEQSSFSRCTNLASIIIDENNSTYDSRDNCNAIIETASNTLIAGCKNSTIPNGVTSIGDKAFQECSGLTSITIPDSVTSIGDSAFDNCWNLTTLTIGSGVTSIGDYAFYIYDGISSITYTGTMTQWKAITRGSSWHRGIKATTVTCSDGTCGLDDK